MTAIFAFVDGNTAFIGADTKRAILGLETTATKIYRWSEHIVMGQCGSARPLARMISEMLLWQDRQPQFVTYDGLVQLFQHRRLDHYTEAVQKSDLGPGSVAGTIVVAVAAHGRDKPMIATFDFSSGTIEKVVLKSGVHGDGADRAGFTKIAQAGIEVAARATELALDKWFLDCIKHTVNSHSDSVGWPADLLITRLDTGVRTTCVRRVHSPSEPVHPSFRIASV